MNDQQNKVFKHPEKEEIIKRLLNGESVKIVEAWLKKKHPKKKSLWISYATLQKFRKDHLHLDGEILENIKAVRKEQDLTSKELEAKVILASSSAYQQKINEIVSNELDGNRKILEMMTLVGSRLEYYFNMLQSGGSIREDKMFVELLNTQRGLVQDWKKYVDGVADKRVEHNININVVNEQVNVLKNIVFEILQELDPKFIPIFIEKINSRLNNMQYGSSQYQQYQQTQSFPQLDIIDVE
jgi:hypothetical protein